MTCHVINLSNNEYFYQGVMLLCSTACTPERDIYFICATGDVSLRQINKSIQVAGQATIFIFSDLYTEHMFSDNACVTVLSAHTTPGEVYRMIRQRQQGLTHFLKSTPPVRITPAERRVIRLLAEHKATDVASLTQLTQKTISTHKTNVMCKLGLKRHTDLTRFIRINLNDNLLL